MLLNPSNALIFFFALVKGLTSQDKRILERIYEKLGSFEIDVIELDCRYSEKDEAEFIKKTLGRVERYKGRNAETSGNLKKKLGPKIRKKS